MIAVSASDNKITEPLSPTLPPTHASDITLEPVKVGVVTGTRKGGKPQQPNKARKIASSRSSHELLSTILATSKADELMKLFESIDQDGNGVVGEEEFVEKMVANGLCDSQEVARELFVKLDKDHSKELRYRELKEAILLAAPSRMKFIGSGALDALKLSGDKHEANAKGVFGSIAIYLIMLTLAPASLAMLTAFRDGSLNEHNWTAMLTADPVKRSTAASHLTMAPVIALMLSIIGHCFMGATDMPSFAAHLGTALAAGARGALGDCLYRLLPTNLTVGIWLLVLLNQSYAAAAEIAADEAVPLVHFYFRLAIAMGLLIAWMSVLAKVESKFEAVLHQQDDLFRESRPIRKWVDIMLSFCTWCKPAEDACYTFQEHSNAADILHEMWIVFEGLAKVAGLVLFMLFYLAAAGDAGSDEPQFGWEKVLFFMLVGMSSILLFVGCSAPAVRNLLQIAISKPFYLGDIINVHGAGSKGGLLENVTGFVESLTFSHVVVRGFDLKQVWISHADFEGLTVTNWTRRPTKLMNVTFALAATSKPEAVKALLAHIKKFAKSNANVRPNSYTKVALKGLNPGYVVQVILYPKIGYSKTKLREELLFDAMDAATRLKLSLTALEVPSFDVGAVGRDDNLISLEQL